MQFTSVHSQNLSVPVTYDLWLDPEAWQNCTDFDSRFMLIIFVGIFNAIQRVEILNAIRRVEILNAIRRVEILNAIQRVEILNAKFDK